MQAARSLARAIARGTRPVPSARATVHNLQHTVSNPSWETKQVATCGGFLDEHPQRWLLDSGTTYNIVDPADCASAVAEQPSRYQT